MRRFFAGLLAVALSFCFVSCGCSLTLPGSGEPMSRGDETEEEKSPLSDLADLFRGFDLSSLLDGEPAEEIRSALSGSGLSDKVLEALKKVGIEVTFGEDGTATLQDGFGHKVIANEDGTFTFLSREGDSRQFGGDWPENEFTRLIPKPDGSPAFAAEKDDSFSIVISGVSADQVRSYIEEVKGSGFTEDAALEDRDVLGMTLISFRALNGNGYKVSISFGAGLLSLSVRKR
ncbi:MAG: hypothetical protein J5938_04835 [Clostridia bacterium]|nr:hypothetical protein [Clostridia bacterium]